MKRTISGLPYWRSTTMSEGIRQVHAGLARVAGSGGIIARKPELTDGNEAIRDMTTTAAAEPSSVPASSAVQGPGRAPALMWLSILAGMAFLLGACNVSKKLETPKPDLPVTYRNGADTTDTLSIATLPYRTFITDKSLQQLIDSAVIRNYDLQNALKNIEAAQLLFRQVKWNNVPGIALNITGSSDRPSDNSLTGLSLQQYNIGGRHLEDYSAGLSISWEADIWAKIKNQRKSALANYLQTIEVKKAVQTMLVSTVSQGYYNLLMLDAQLQIARQNVLLNDSTLGIIRLQYTAGQVTQLAVQQAEAQQLAAAELIPQFEQNIGIQEDALSVLAGTLPVRVKRELSLNELSLPIVLPAGIPSSLVSRRPDVRSAELALVIAGAQVGIRKAQMYPALNITASGGLNSFKASNWFSIPASLFGLVAGSVVQPLVEHKLLRTQYEVAEVDRERSVIAFRKSVLVAVGEVSDALVEIEKLKTRQAIASRRVEVLEKATANASLLFRNGMATYLEVITAQGNVLQSQLELAAIRRDQFGAVAELYRSLGGGWN